jgi:hypothetical protein
LNNGEARRGKPTAILTDFGLMRMRDKGIAIGRKLGNFFAATALLFWKLQLIA